VLRAGERHEPDLVQAGVPRREPIPDDREPVLPLAAEQDAAFLTDELRDVRPGAEPTGPRGLLQARHAGLRRGPDRLGAARDAEDILDVLRPDQRVHGSHHDQ
jgi:hypothetical protein